MMGAIVLDVADPVSTDFGKSSPFLGVVPSEPAYAWGYQAQHDITTGYDMHATILHLLGIDHAKLTVRANGVDRRLTDVHGHVIQEVLA